MRHGHGFCYALRGRGGYLRFVRHDKSRGGRHPREDKAVRWSAINRRRSQCLTQRATNLAFARQILTLQRQLHFFEDGFGSGQFSLGPCRRGKVRYELTKNMDTSFKKGGYVELHQQNTKLIVSPSTKPKPAGCQYTI